jgi:hypothetical protein
MHDATKEHPCRSADRLKIGRIKEKECAEAMCANAQIRAYWRPPRAQYQRIADNTGQDVFGVFDFVAIDHFGAIVGVQVCRKRPGEICIRKAKIGSFCRTYTPALRPFIAYYDKSGFMLEELMPDFVWRLKALLPYEVKTVDNTPKQWSRTSRG